MAGLVPQSSWDILSGISYNHFLTFARPIVIVKESEKIFVSESENAFFGIPAGESLESVQEIPVTGEFLAIKRGPEGRNEIPHPSIHNSSPDNKSYIKVLSDCRDFIEDGKTNYVIMDGLKFNIDSRHSLQVFNNYPFYLYEIIRLD